jgi:hypothetical protein
LGFQGVVGVVPECHRQLRGGRDDVRKTDDGRHGDQHVDDLGSGGAASNAASAWAS